MRSRGVNQENVGKTGEKITRENVNMPDLETARICIVKNTTLKKVMRHKKNRLLKPTPLVS